jgi:hypothetical protein
MLDATVLWVGVYGDWNFRTSYELIQDILTTAEELIVM